MTDLNMVVFLEQDAAALFASLEQLKLTALLIVGFVILISFIFACLLSGFILRPIRELQNQVQMIDLDHMQIDIDRKSRVDEIMEVRNKTDDIPVVMHGGSGISEQDFLKSIDAGVRKINYFTYMDTAGGKAVADYMKANPERKPLHFMRIAKAAKEAMKEDVKRAMKVFAKVKA